MPNKYEWKDSYERKGLPEKLIKKVFNRLNNGVPYTNESGKFIGYIAAVEGPFGIMHIISDHSLSSETWPYVAIRVLYIDAFVLYFILDNEKINLYEFNNGYWANRI